MEEAVQRIRRAIENGELIVVVGDYDVDGVSSTAILAAVFQVLGAKVKMVIPDRLRDGYGLQLSHVRWAAERGAGLIVTCDCGSTAIEPVKSALQSGVDVIVTDHHRPGLPLPARAIEINPHRRQGSYPFQDLSGAGLALKVAMALAGLSKRAFETDGLLRVACLGTISDMVPLTGENRTIAALGLRALPNTRSPGLQALMRTARLRPPLAAKDVALRVGPRLNAAGRLASADLALSLLLTRDSRRAREVAEELERLNRERQEEEATVVAEAREVLADRQTPGIIVLWSHDWHPGVVGIAATRLTQRFHRPALLFAVRDGIARGSGRSVKGVDLHAFLAPWASKLERFGGHRAAVGLTVSEEQLPELRSAWVEAASSWPSDLLEGNMTYELELTPSDINRSLIDDLAKLEPFGTANPQPRARLAPLRLVQEPRIFGRGHVEALAEDAGKPGRRLRLVGWRWAERREDLDGTFEALGHVELDRYHDEPCFRLVEARPWAEAPSGPTHAGG